MRYVTMFGVLVLGLSILFFFVALGGNAIVPMIAFGGLLVGIGVLTNL